MYANPSAHHFYNLDRELLPIWHWYFYLCVSFMKSGMEVICEILLFLGLKSYTKTHLTWRVVVIVCFSRTSDWSNTSEVQRCQALNLQTPNETWVFMFGWEADLLGMGLFCVTSVVACFYFQKLYYVYIFQGCSIAMFLKNSYKLVKLGMLALIINKLENEVGICIQH